MESSENVRIGLRKDGVRNENLVKWSNVFDITSNQDEQEVDFQIRIGDSEKNSKIKGNQTYFGWF